MISCAGGGLVDIGVGFGLELVGEEPAIRLGQLDRLAVHAQSLLGARRQHHLGSENPHQLAPLDGETVRHGHDQRIAFLCTDHGKTDAGVAAGRFDDSLTGLQRAAALGGLDDVDGEPVFHGGCGIERLGLGVELDAFGSML